jgi:hypothetical protein
MDFEKSSDRALGRQNSGDSVPTITYICAIGIFKRDVTEMNDII